jgi:hypothetical protein
MQTATSTAIQFLLHGVIFQKNGSFYGACLELCVSASGKTYEEVSNRLQHLIKGHLDCGSGGEAYEYARKKNPQLNIATYRGFFRCTEIYALDYLWKNGGDVRQEVPSIYRDPGKNIIYNYQEISVEYSPSRSERDSDYPS